MSVLRYLVTSKECSAIDTQKGKKGSQSHMRMNLMDMDTIINGKKIRVLVDIGAFQNYLASTHVQRLNLKLSKGESRAKAVNSTSQQVATVATNVPLKVGPLERKTTFSVINMDDVELILELDFLRESKVAILPQKRMLMMPGDKLRIIPTLDGSMVGSSWLVLQTLEKTNRYPFVEQEYIRMGRYELSLLRSKAA